MSTTFDRIMQKANKADPGGEPRGSMYNRIMQKSKLPDNKIFYDIKQPPAAANRNIESWSDLNYESPPLELSTPKTDFFDKTVKYEPPKAAADAQQTANYNRLQQIAAGGNKRPKVTTVPLASGRDFAVTPGVETGGKLGAGFKSIGQTTKAALPMLGSTAAQAAENAAAAANSKEYAAKRAQLFMLQNGLSNIPEYEKRKEQEDAARAALQNVVAEEQLDKPVSPDSLGMQMMGKAKEYQQQAVEGLSPTGQFIGNTLLSIGQNAALLPTAAINPAAPLIGMGAIAAADKSYELSEQGIGAGEALARGIISGGIESLTEKLPLDNLLKVANSTAGRNAIKNILKQMGMEATEEAASYVINYGADKLARDPNAQFSLQELAMSAAGGALSGGIMGGAATGFNRLGNVAQYSGQNVPQTSQNVTESAQSVIEPAETVVAVKENPVNPQTVGDLSKEQVQSAQPQAAQPDMLAPLREKMQANKNEMQRLSDQRQKLREAQQLKRESYSTMDAAELMQRLEDIRQQPQGYRTQAIRKLAGDIVDSAQMRDRTLTEQYNEARQLVRNTRFALAERDRADLGMSYADFARENKGKIKLGDDGSRVDSVYTELNTIAPDMFPADITHPADQLRQIAYFMDITAPGFVNPYSEDIESGIGYIENRLKKAVGEPDLLKPLTDAMQTAEPQQEYADEYIDDYDVPPIGLTAEEYAQLQNNEDAEISRDLNERLDQIIKEYEAERVFDDAEKLRKADVGVREAVMEFITSDEGITEGADLTDVAGLLQNGFFYNIDISRALDHTARAGKRGELKLTKETAKQIRDALYQAIEKPWIEAKAGYTDGVTAQINRVADIFGKLGIKPGSKESAAVQWIGEGQRQIGKEIAEYTESDLKRDFPDRWQDIMKGAAAARQIYDEYIGKVNAARVKMYPELEAKAQNEINRLNAVANRYHANARAQEQYIEQKRAELAQVRSQIKGGNTLTQTDLARQRQALALENTIMAAEQKRNSQLARAQQYDARAAEIQKQIDTGEILRQKRLLPRKDYFHHFTEMAEGFGGLVNILNTPSDISSNLAGVSEYTKPKGKFWGALEQRKGGAYTEDAVGGLAKYIPAAEYAVNIDPFIAHMRGTIKNLAVATAETKNANSLITYLTDWTNELAGKTNKFDRGIMDAFPDRRFMRALTWVNNRVKANAVVGNLSSAIVQVGNIPNATTYIPNPQRWAEAFEKLTTGQGNLNESSFLKERYLGSTLERLENKSGVRKAAEGLLEFGDHQAAKLIWQTAYEQYNKGGPRRGKRSYQNAADYADDITRRSIAGRGIGELPITQKSKLIGLASPFMVEVNNTYHVVKDAIGESDAAGVMALAITANLLNALMEPLRGNRPLFDPIDAGWDALKILVGKEEAEYIWELLRASDEPEQEPEEDLYMLKEMGRRLRDAGKRLGGEVVGNLPYAQALATMLGSENSEKLFGEADPTRYGTGNIGLSAIAEPIAQIANGEKVDWLGAAANIATPYGGKQLERVIRGAQDIGWLPYDTELTEEGIEFKRNQMPLARSAKGNVQFPITSAGDMVKDMLLGKWSTEAGRQYLDAGNMPLTENQTAQLEEAIEMGIPAEVYYKAYRAQVKQVSDKDKDGKTIKNSQSKNKKKVIDQEAQGLTKAQRQKLYEYFGVRKEVW